MKGYMRYMQTWVDADGIMFSQRTNHEGELVRWYNLGEWVAPGETVPDAMVHTFYLWYCADITARTARALGKEEEAAQNAAIADKTKDAFHQRFYNEQGGTYGDGGGNILALKMGVPEERYQRVIAALKKSVAANDGHLDTGIFGTRFYFEVLAENGMNDLAYEAMNKTTEPSFGHWIELGSTTSRERWDEGGSHNHPMFGGGLVWFYQNLAGMKADESHPGYRHIIFKPQPLPALNSTRYMTETSYGDGGIEWTKQDDQFTMDVTVPVGCTATVFVPASDGQTVSVAGGIDAEHITQSGKENGFTRYEVQSGKYTFEVR
jgi:alpha-L-rhamnosidase